MKIVTADSTLADAGAAAAELVDTLRGKGCRAPELLICVGTATHDMDIVRATLAAAFPKAALQGGTSCAGVMTERGHRSADGRALGVFAVEDPAGDYGVGAARLTDPFDAGATAARRAVAAADRRGERPEACWLLSAPGAEERVLAGVQSVVGANVPLIGGSSADNTVEGAWRQFDRDGVYADAVVLAALYPSDDVAVRFHSGYDATERTGVITAAEGRKIFEIDGRPAAAVYDAWTGGAISDLLAQGGVVLERSTVFPLGRKIATVGGEPYFLLSHPEAVTADGALTVFTDVAVGDELIGMRGDRRNLIDRAGNVAAAARDAEEMRRGEIAGSLVIFCAGCMMALGDQIDEAQAKIRSELGPQTPFLGAYTFGEQGFMADGANRHGNLMISVMHFAGGPGA